MGVETGEFRDARDASALWIFILAVCLPPPDCNLTGGNELFPRIEEYRARVGIYYCGEKSRIKNNNTQRRIRIYQWRWISSLSCWPCSRYASKPLLSLMDLVPKSLFTLIHHYIRPVDLLRLAMKMRHQMCGSLGMCFDLSAKAPSS